MIPSRASKHWAELWHVLLFPICTCQHPPHPPYSAWPCSPSLRGAAWWGLSHARLGRTCPKLCCNPPSPLLSFPLKPPVLLKSLFSSRAGTGTAMVTAFAHLALHKDEENQERCSGLRGGHLGLGGCTGSAMLTPPAAPQGRVASQTKLSFSRVCLSLSFVSSVEGFP